MSISGILNREFDDSKNLRNHGEIVFIEEYERARKQASIETELPISTFPEKPPFSFEQAIDEDYLPE